MLATLILVAAMGLVATICVTGPAAAPILTTFALSVTAPAGIAPDSTIANGSPTTNPWVLATLTFCAPPSAGAIIVVAGPAGVPILAIVASSALPPTSMMI